MFSFFKKKLPVSTNPTKRTFGVGEVKTLGFYVWREIYTPNSGRTNSSYLSCDGNWYSNMLGVPAVPMTHPPIPGTYDYRLEIPWGPKPTTGGTYWIEETAKYMLELVRRIDEIQYGNVDTRVLALQIEQCERKLDQILGKRNDNATIQSEENVFRMSLQG